MIYTFFGGAESFISDSILQILKGWTTEIDMYVFILIAVHK